MSDVNYYKLGVRSSRTAFTKQFTQVGEWKPYRVGTEIETADNLTIQVGTEGIFGTGFLADIYQEGADLNDEVKAFGLDLYSQLPQELRDLWMSEGGASKSPSFKKGPSPTADVETYSKWNYYTSVWMPFRDGWMSFVDNKLRGSLAKFTNWASPFVARQVWKDIQEYRAKLKAMYAFAPAAGFRPAGPPPSDPKKNLLECMYGKAVGVGGEVWGLAKFVLYAIVLLLGGMLVLKFVAVMRS